MARYIDADNVLDNFECNGECLTCQFNADPFCYVKGLIASEPTADVREEIHGHWKLNGTRLCECSVCGAEGNTSGHDNYCRNCGAVMDEIECKNCGAFSIRGMNYCSHCGTIIDKSEEE